ncbi:MAG: L,D-transpeptidase [Candidatus Nanoarchaeia archaeon]|nr:L,D-transpeptidase [Candidatus Nanoarchaeia archaeon]
MKFSASIPLLPKSLETQICGYATSYELVFDCSELDDIIKDDFFIDQKLLRQKIKEKTEKQIPYYLFGTLLDNITNNIALELNESLPLKECIFTIDIPENYLVDSMDLSLEVNKTNFNLKLFQKYNNNNILLLESGVAIGRGEYSGGKFKTPEGDFFLQRIILDPWWYPPEWAGTTIPEKPGINNPYGLYMAEICSVDSLSGYEFSPRGDTGTRLHGTNKPRSIGTAASHGCIRVGEVEELFKGMFNYVRTREGKTTGRGNIHPLEKVIPIKIYKN